MADDGVMEVIPVGGVEEQGALTLSEGGELDSPNVRRSERKNSLRSTSARGHRAKLGPKSPMMRMAEKRKCGLRGRALRHSGLKGLDGSDLKANKGKMGFGGRGLLVLMSFSDCKETDVRVVEGLGAVGSAGGGDGAAGGDVVVMVDDQKIAEHVGPIVIAVKGFDILPQLGNGAEGMTLDVRDGVEEVEGSIVKEGVILQTLQK